MQTLPIAIERGAAEPLYRQIEDQIRAAIRDGRLHSGVRLPGIRALAEQLGTARITVATAYEDLASEGYVVGRAGAGTRVADALPDDGLWTRHGNRAPRTEPTKIRRWHFPRGNGSPAAAAGGLEADLRPGGIGLDLFPSKLWGRLLQAAWLDIASEDDQAKATHDLRLGDPRLREAVSRFVGPWRGVHSTPDNVVIFPSVTAVCGVVARAFLPENGTCALEDPGCPYFTRALGARGATLSPVPVDEDGLDPEALPTQADLLLVAPAWQYPLGGTMTLARRRALLDWANRADAIVLEHDWAGAIRYLGAPMPSLQSNDVAGRVIYVGSFLEVVAAGNAAFAVVPDQLMPRFKASLVGSDMQPSQLDQRTLALFLLDGHLDRHIRRARLALQERQEYLIGLLRGELGPSIEVRTQAAGGHVLVYFPWVAKIRARDIAERCEKLGVRLSAMSEFALGSQSEEAIVMSFAGARPSQLRTAVAALRRAIEDMSGRDLEQAGA